MWEGRKNSREGEQSSHNELYAQNAAAKAAVHQRKLFDDMHLGELSAASAKPIKLIGDNLQALTYSREENVTNGNRYYDRDLRFNKRRVEDGTVDTRDINTKENISDLGTKPPEGPEVRRLGSLLNGNGGLLPDPPPPIKT